MMRKDRDILKQSSYQYAQLRRKLSFSLALNWFVYTVVFLLVAVALNFTFVPWIADKIADSTSEWHEWLYDDYPLDQCLEELDLTFIGVTSSILEPSRSSHSTSEEDAVREGDASVIVESEALEANDASEFDIEGRTLSEVVLDENTGETVLVITDYPKENIGPYTSIIVRYEEAYDDIGPFPRYATMTLRDLQQQLIGAKFLNDLEYDSYKNMQVLYGENSVMARDLTSYNFVKQFKYPLAICLYLIGCIVLIFLGYGRAMRYFAELSNAVGDLISDKEKPIELSPALSITQDELNSIRVASLADERAAKYAERRKDELVAYLAHDIKTPLTSIMGYLMLLDEAPDMPQEQRQRFVATAADKAQRLEALMDEFFEITRYNLQAIPIERANVDVQLLLAQVADEFYPDAQAKGIEIDVDAPADEPIFVDGNKFARALGNIMRNAIAYADADSKVMLAANADDEHWTITVKNRGREISETHLQSIFEKFYREDEARSSKSGGAGLGLAIAKEIVVAHGGTIAAESKNGTTIFTIAMPR